MHFQKLFKSAITFNLIILLLCLVGVTQLQRQKYQALQKQNSHNNHERITIAQQNWLAFQENIPDFGFSNLIADDIFLRFIQYFGDRPAREANGYTLVPQYFEAIVDRDPNFANAYFTLANANTMYAGEPGKTVNLTTQLLNSGEINHKDRAFLWANKGADELLLLGDIDAAQNSYQIAGNLAQLANDNDRDRLAQSYFQTANFLATNPDIQEAQILAWSMILPNIRDHQKRAEILLTIESLKADTQDVELVVAEED